MKVTSNKFAYDVLLILILYWHSPMLAGDPMNLKVTATGDLALWRGGTLFETIETWAITAYARADEYRIVGEGVVGAIRLKQDIGFDGVDTFFLSDGRGAILPQGSVELEGIAYSGRFPENSSIVLQSVWMALCSKGYFVEPLHRTNLKLDAVLNWSPADFVTNVVDYWDGSTVPKRVMGWSKNWVRIPGSGGDQQLKHYPNGFKVWELETSDVEHIGEFVVPRQITMHGFAPRPPETSESGTAVTLTRRVRISVGSAEVVKQVFNVFPDVPVPEILVVDRRFLSETGRRVLIAHARAPNIWPTRNSPDMEKVRARVRAISAANGVDQAADQAAPVNRILVLGLFFGMNLILLTLLGKYLKRKRVTH